MGDDFLAVAALYAVGAAVLAVLPFLPIFIGSRIINTLQDARLPWTPAIEILALAIGVVAGGIVLAANIDPETVTASAIFRKGGYWDLPPDAFLAMRADPRIYDWSQLVPWPFGTWRGLSLSLMVAIGAAIVAYLPLLFFGTLRAAANGARNMLIVIWAAGATVYFFNYVLWVANELNFWLFLVLLVFLQVSRKKSEKPVVKIGG